VSMAYCAQKVPVEQAVAVRMAPPQVHPFLSSDRFQPSRLCSSIESFSLNRSRPGHATPPAESQPLAGARSHRAPPIRTPRHGPEHPLHLFCEQPHGDQAERHAQSGHFIRASRAISTPFKGKLGAIPVRDNTLLFNEIIATDGLWRRQRNPSPVGPPCRHRSSARASPSRKGRGLKRLRPRPKLRGIYARIERERKRTHACTTFR